MAQAIRDGLHAGDDQGTAESGAGRLSGGIPGSGNGTHQDREGSPAQLAAERKRIQGQTVEEWLAEYGDEEE